jgi:hypothetical protein
MMVKKWDLLNIVITVIWLIVFVLNFFVHETWVNVVLSIVTIFFVFDLIYIYKNRNSTKDFFRQNWFDIIMLIPFFRIFKVGKIVRVLKISKTAKNIKHIERTLEATQQIVEGVDLAQKTHQIKKREDSNKID